MLRLLKVRSANTREAILRTKYLQFFPTPLLDDLATGHWLPVVGAGMSLNANAPRGKKLPLWSELGSQLSKDIKEYDPSGPLDAISAFEHEFGRPKLVERLSDLLLVSEASPGIAHEAFCSIPFDIVCTTNFDFLLDRQYGAGFHPVVGEDQLSINFKNAGTRLLKIHGDLHHPNRLVVSEKDYDGFLTDYPLLATYLANQLITKTAVFIGYSLDDPDFRQVIHVVNQRLGKCRRTPFAIVVNANSSDARRYERRGVQVISLPGSRSNYGQVLATAFKELKEYWRETVISVSTVTEERPLRELKLPRDTTSRLCFFAITLELLPFYRERVFPIVEDAGWVPVTADDIISPGDSVSAKIDALIDRAAVVVVEPGTDWTNTEYRMALARQRREQRVGDHKNRLTVITVINTEPEQVELPVDSHKIYRPSTLSPQIENFIQSLEQLLKDIAQEAIGTRNGEPIRLFLAGEYRAAVIAAVTLLEAALRTRLNKRLDVPEESRMSIQNLISRAENRGVQFSVPAEKIRSWVALRNKAVHTEASITRANAQDAVYGIINLLQQL